MHVDTAWRRRAGKGRRSAARAVQMYDIALRLAVQCGAAGGMAWHGWVQRVSGPGRAEMHKRRALFHGTNAIESSEQTNGAAVPAGGLVGSCKCEKLSSSSPSSTRSSSRRRTDCTCT